MDDKEAKVYRFKDIFKAWNHSFRFHRLMISALALILSAIIVVLLVDFSLFAPSGFLNFQSFFSTFCTFSNILALILAAIIFFIARMSIAYSIRREVVDDEIFVGWKDVGKFLGKHLKTLLFYIIGWIVIFILIGLGQLFFYAIGAIPYVGSLWLSIMYLIPFAISVFMMLTLVVMLFCEKFGPVLIGVEQDSAMDTIISLYHLVKDHGVYIVVTSFISALVGAIAYVFVLFILRSAVVVTNFGANFVMGREFAKITIPKYFSFLNVIFPSLQSYANAGGWYTVPGFIISIFLIIIAGIGLAYIVTYMTAAQTFIYLSSQDKFYPKKEEETEPETEKEEESKEESEEESEKSETEEKETE